MANIKNELNKIKTAVYGKDVRGSIHDGIEKINKETEIATNKSEQAHDVMESIIKDGFDNAALEAKFEQKLDDEIGQLQPGWTGFKDDVTTQLAEKADKQSISNSLNLLKSQKIDRVNFDVATKKVNFYADENLINVIDITEASNASLVQDYIDTLVSDGHIKGVTLADGSVMTEKYANKSITPEKTTFIKVSKNILDPKYFVRGKVVNPSTGILSDSSSNSCFHLIPISQAGFYVRNFSAPRQVAFYDAGGDYLRPKSSDPFVVEGDVGYLTINVPGNDCDGLQVEKGESSTSYEPYFNPKFEGVDKGKIEESDVESGFIKYYHTDFVKTGKNILDVSKVVPGKVLAWRSGDISDSSNNSYVSYTKIKPNTTYIANWSNIKGFLFYDKEGVYINGYNESNVFTTPDNAYTLQFNIPGKTGEGLQIEEGTESTPYEQLHYKFKGTPKKDIDRHVAIRYSLSDDTSTCERLDGIAALDELDGMYPYDSIKLCNVQKTDWGATKITYADEPGFKRGGSNGEVMVEIPKHYFKRYRKDGYEYLELSGEQKDGFQIDPTFTENGREINAVYVGVYDGYDNGARLRSVSGQFPTTNISLDDLRVKAKANGVGFGLLDYRTVAMLQRLFLVYFADRNSQKVVGEGFTQLHYETFNTTLARNTANSSNYIEVDESSRSYRKFLVGDRVTVSADAFIFEDRKITNVSKRDNISEITFDGDPVDVVAGTTRIYHTPQKTGQTDSMQAHSGSANLYEEEGHDAVKLFHIENLWGNVWTLLDGVYLANLVAYVGEDMQQYGNVNFKDTYRPLPMKFPRQVDNTQDSNTEFDFFIKNLALDKINPAYQLPLELGTSGDNSRFCDPWYAGDRSAGIPSFGGGWDLWFRAGIFTTRFWYDSDTENALNGGRLIYKPI